MCQFGTCFQSVPNHNLLHIASISITFKQLVTWIMQFYSLFLFTIYMIFCVRLIWYNEYLALWILMVCYFNARASVATMLSRTLAFPAVYGLILMCLILLLVLLLLQRFNSPQDPVFHLFSACRDVILPKEILLSFALNYTHVYKTTPFYHHLSCG